MRIAPSLPFDPDDTPMDSVCQHGLAWQEARERGSAYRVGENPADPVARPDRTGGRP